MIAASMVKNEGQALAYATECALATVEDFAISKSKRRARGDYARHIKIAQNLFGWLKEFNLIADGSRASEILSVFDSSVKAWSEHVEKTLG